MKTKWKGGILLPVPGRNAYGHYEILGEDDAVLGHLVVENNGGPGKPFKVGITTDREIDLEATALAFVGDEDGTGSAPERLWVLDAGATDDPIPMFWGSEPPGWAKGDPWPPRERVTVYVRGDRYAEAMERIRLIEDEVGRQVRKRGDMLAALKAMTERYVDLAASGDCGHWDPEEEEVVIRARAAIAEARGEGDG